MSWFAGITTLYQQQQNRLLHNSLVSVCLASLDQDAITSMEGLDAIIELYRELAIKHISVVSFDAPIVFCEWGRELDES